MSPPGAAAGIRADINKAYAAVEEPNAYKPADFRTALASAVAAIRRLQLTMAGGWKILVGAPLLVLAACGGGDTSAPAGGGTGNAPPPPPPPPPPPAGQFFNFPAIESLERCRGCSRSSRKLPRKPTRKACQPPSLWLIVRAMCSPCSRCHNSVAKFVAVTDAPNGDNDRHSGARCSRCRRGHREGDHRRVSVERRQCVFDPRCIANRAGALPAFSDNNRP